MVKDASKTAAMELPEDLGDPLDLQRMIDEAIAEAKAAGAPPVESDEPIPDLQPPPPPPSPPAVESPEPLAAEAAAEPVAESNAEVDLAAQIDRLLDAGRQSVAAPAERAPAQPVGAVVEPEPEDAGKATSAEPDLAQLDRMLAENADVAIADELAETPQPPPDPPAPEAEPVAEAPAEEPEAEAVEEEAAEPVAELPSRRLRMPSVRELLTIESARRVCIVLNRPIANASAQTRDLIGLVGLITMGNALALMLYALFRV